MFVCLTYRTKFLVRVCPFIKRMNINELPVERFMNCSMNVRFVYSLTHIQTVIQGVFISEPTIYVYMYTHICVCVLN
ncbi:hypothetical protein Hanom_Chr04g00289401 [Helianthus anomalus]